MVIKTPLVVVEQKLIVAGHYNTILYLRRKNLEKHCISMQSRSEVQTALWQIQVFACATLF